MPFVFRKFPNDSSPPIVMRGDGAYLHLSDGRRVIDMTAGWTSYAVLGYNHPEVLDAMRVQMEKFCHIDFNAWTNPALEDLARILIAAAPKGLDRVYFSGNSGSEAIEAAMKLSYQVHFDGGKKKKSWFISRNQSFHGATLHGISISEMPILEFYGQILPGRCARITQHHPLYHRRADESLDDYARRGARELEDKILEIGPENVCAFVGETQLGALVGNVPPAPNYWKYVREVCDRHDVHLILDEIYCGLGRSGRVYNCAWDDVVPDFVCVGKNLAGGYVPLSAVITKSEFEDVIAKGQGRIQHGHTHQGHSLGVAAALAVQRIVQTDTMLKHISETGEFMREALRAELGAHPFFRDLRGRGLMFSLEYNCADNPGFGRALREIMDAEHNILVNAKWHHASFTPPYTVTRGQVEQVLDRFIATFRRVAMTFNQPTGA